MGKTVKSVSRKGANSTAKRWQGVLLPPVSLCEPGLQATSNMFRQDRAKQESKYF